jgi:hypothetical protein
MATAPDGISRISVSTSQVASDCERSFDSGVFELSLRELHKEDVRDCKLAPEYEAMLTIPFRAIVRVKGVNASLSPIS